MCFFALSRWSQRGERTRGRCWKSGPRKRRVKENDIIIIIIFCGSLYKHIHSARVTQEMALKADKEQKSGNIFLICGGIYFNMWGGVLFLYILADEPCDSEGGSGCSDDGAEGCGQAEKGK